MYSLHEILQAIDPSSLTYDEWSAVGMAIKHEGGDVSDWDSWSAADPGRYHPGECARKWASFGGSASPVTMGTLVQFARRQGWAPTGEYFGDSGEGRALDWDEPPIPASAFREGGPTDEYKLVDLDWLEDADLQEPTDSDWKPIDQIIQYLETLYKPDEYVGYVMESTLRGDKLLPANRGVYSETCAEIIASLKRYNDIGKAMGDYDPDAGAWVRFNPLDGAGVKDENVTAYRYALIECDTDDMPPEKQAAVYEKMELPIAVMVHSGRKSMHAIVRIEADTIDEYRERVNFLHSICRKNGLEIDKANKNPSRLSRLPGIVRGDAKQYIAAVNIGQPSWSAWKNHIEELNDNLPDIEPLADVWEHLPDLSPPLISGILRQGHKMLLAGPSKAGKSFMLLQLAIAIAEGRDWLGWKCAQGKVLYVNLELDRPSALHRLKTLYDATRIPPTNIKNIDLWNLRGKAMPLDKLAPKLVRRALKQRYTAIIVDPIYKVLTGDENSAHEMAMFTNQFDLIATELGASVIFCHHHSKGEQGHKMSRDRASGSGVFSRDPDALLDLIELHITDERRSAIREKLSVEGQAPGETFTGWRIEGTIREFPPLAKTCFFFDYPRHYPDGWDLLTDANAAGEVDKWTQSRQDKQERKQTRGEQIEAAYHAAKGFGDEKNDVALIGDMAEFCGIEAATLKRWIRQTKKYVVGKDDAVRTKDENDIYLLTQAIEKARDVTGEVRVVNVEKVMKVCDKTVRSYAEKAGYKIKNGRIFS